MLLPMDARACSACIGAAIRSSQWPMHWPTPAGTRKGGIRRRTSRIPKAPPSSFYIEGPVSIRNNRWAHGYDPNAAPKADIGKKTIAGTADPDLYRTCRYDLLGYRLKIPNGQYRVTLKFCEIAFQKKGQRVFDVALQKNLVLKGLDIFARSAPCQLAMSPLTTSRFQINGW